MSNLATMVMEGVYSGSSRLSRHYDHENGAGLIAMESAEALNAIFEAQFYTPNSCTIQAALEGYSSVEESSTQAAIMEAAFKSAFEKIKQFFIDLKDKVKDFLHNIKRYLTGIFGNDEKWVKTYEKELKALKASDLKDYKVKMYNYTIDAALSKVDLAAAADKLMAKVDGRIKEIERASIGQKPDTVDEESFQNDAEAEYLAFLKDELVGKSVDADELDKALWSRMRDDADGEGDKEEVQVASKMTTMIDALKNSSKTISAYDTMISKTESMYQKAIKLVDKTEKGFKVNEKTGNEGAVQHASAGLRVYSSTLSKMQSAHNKLNNAAKSALVERNSAYKSALTGAFSYARKHKGGK